MNERATASGDRVEAIATSPKLSAAALAVSRDRVEAIATSPKLSAVALAASRDRVEAKDREWVV
jgi:hypothetical protein